jgi:hypothetical protein
MTKGNSEPHACDPEFATTASQGRAGPSRDERGTGEHSGNVAEESESLEWEGQPFRISYKSSVVESQVPHSDPTLFFQAWTGIYLWGHNEPYPIYRVRVTSTVEYRPYGDPKPFRPLETREEKEFDSGLVALSWSRSTPFAWEAQIQSEHGWIMEKGEPEATRASSDGPVAAHNAMRILP